MDASCKIQRSIHDVRLTYKYVSRILGTYQTGVAIFVAYYYPYELGVFIKKCLVLWIS